MGRPREACEARFLTLANDPSAREPDDAVENLRVQVALAKAIEQGRMVEDSVAELDGAIEPQAVTGNGSASIPGIASMVELANRWRQRQARKVTPQRRERIALLIDDFAHAFADVAHLSGHNDAVTSHDKVATWSAAVRSQDRTVHDVYGELRALLGQLRREQTRRSLQQSRES